ncbi:MAG: restriction endonuclease subunit S [Dysgonamonadaceae bacterium]|nr:restriction endonuclease subunit S [Dysgonamonadaceae bacterium]
MVKDSKKNNWQTKKLSEVCDFSRGLTYSKKDEVDFSDNIVLRSNNIDLKSSLLDLSDLRYINNKIIIPDNKRVRRGSIIICTANGSKSHLGKIALIDDDYEYAFGGFMGQLTPKECIDSKYFFYNLNSSFYKDHLEKISSGANINNLKFSDLKDLEIPLPPLSEQHHIVKILDEVFVDVAKAKENAGKNLQNAKELFESYLQSVFANPGKDWEEKRLGEAYDVRDGTHDSPKYQKEGYALITSKNLKRDELDYQKIKYISEKDYKKINERSKVHKGDILFAMIGTIGNPVVIKTEPDFAIKNVALFKIPKDQNSYFLKYFLDSKFVIDKMMSEAKGTTQKFVGLGYLRNFKIQLPNLDEQKAIVAKLDTLSAETKKLETIYQQKLADLEELKKSVLRRAFNGDL